MEDNDVSEYDQIVLMESILDNLKILDYETKFLNEKYKTN